MLVVDEEDAIDNGSSVYVAGAETRRSTPCSAGAETGLSPELRRLGGHRSPAWRRRSKGQMSEVSARPTYCSLSLRFRNRE